MARKKIGRSLFINQFIEKGIQYRIINEGKISFVVPSLREHLTDITLMVEELMWEVEICSFITNL